MAGARVMTLVPVAVAALLGASAWAQGPQQGNDATVVLLAGERAGGWKDALGTAAQFSAPAGIALDGNGNVLVADMQNHRIRRTTPDGVVETLAGSGEGDATDGVGLLAEFNAPAGVDVGPDGDVYVADYHNGLVRKATSAGGIVSDATPGLFWARPRDVAVAPDGRILVAEADAGWVRRVDPATGRREVVTSGLDEPWSVDVGPDGAVYVTDYGRQRIREVSRTGRTYRTFAGTGEYGVRDGPPGYATFGRPAAVDVDEDGYVWVADAETHRIRVVSPEGVVATVAGSERGARNGRADEARFDGPRGIAYAGDGIVYVSDRANNAIRKIAGVDKRRLTRPPAVGTTRDGALERGIPVTCGGNDEGTCRLRVSYRGEVFARRTVRLDSPGRRKIYVRIPARARSAVRRDARTAFVVSGTFDGPSGRRRLPTTRVVAR